MIAHHVSSVLNRASIATHGLDWRRMGPARGIAGGRVAEKEGCFLALSEHERDWFVRMNNTGGPVDVWEVSDVVVDELIIAPAGYPYRPGVISPDKIRLTQCDIPPGSTTAAQGEAVIGP